MRSALQQWQQVEECDLILAALVSDQDAIAGLDETEVRDGAACIAQKLLFEPAHASGVTPWAWRNSICACGRMCPASCSWTRPASSATPAGSSPPRSSAGAANRS